MLLALIHRWTEPESVRIAREIAKFTAWNEGYQMGYRVAMTTGARRPPLSPPP
jgi:hypothetical protein